MLQVGEDRLGRQAHSVRPVVKDSDHLAVVATRFSGLLDDQRPVESSVALQPDVGMVEVGAGVRGGELVAELLARFDRGLGQSWNAVHIVAERDPVPMDRW